MRIVYEEHVFFCYCFGPNIMILHLQDEPKQRTQQLIMSHHVKCLRTLKCPDKAHGAVAMDQVGVRLFPVAATPMLHHIIIPLIITLRKRKKSLTHCTFSTFFIITWSKHVTKCTVVTHSEEVQFAVGCAGGVKHKGDARQFGLFTVFDQGLRQPVDTYDISLHYPTCHLHHFFMFDPL